MVAKLTRVNGVLKVDIDGQIIEPLAFKSFRPSKENIADFAKAGVRLFSILTTGRNCAGRKGTLVSIAIHFGQADLTHTCSCCGCTTADSAEESTGNFGSDSKTAAYTADPLVASCIKILADACIKTYAAHQSKHRYNNQ